MQYQHLFSLSHSKNFAGIIAENHKNFDFVVEIFDQIQIIAEKNIMITVEMEKTVASRNLRVTVMHRKEAAFILLEEAFHSSSYDNRFRNCQDHNHSSD